MARRGLIQTFETDSGFNAVDAFWVIDITTLDYVNRSGTIYLTAYKDKRAAKKGLKSCSTRAYSLTPAMLDTLEAVKISDSIGTPYASKPIGKTLEGAIFFFLKSHKDVLVTPAVTDPDTGVVTPAVYKSFFETATEADEE